MKKLIFRLSIVLVFASIGNSAVGNAPESCLLFSITSLNKARLGVINATQQSANLKILNKEGISVYNQIVSKSSNYFKTMSLSGIPDGQYTIRLHIGGKQYDKRFAITNSKAEVLKEPERRPPRFKLVDNSSLIVSYHNTFNEVVSVFFMQNDDVVFEDRGMVTPTILKRYSLEKFPAGTYTVKLYSDGEIYTYPLEIN